MPSEGPEAQFFGFLREGKFMLQRNRKSGVYFFYPRSFTSGATGEDLEWVEATGRGIVYSATVIRRKAEQGGNYNISIVQLAEGPRMLTRVLGTDPQAAFIGMPVVARIEPPSWASAAEPVVVFYPADRP
jgi:hypothetical protein